MCHLTQVRLEIARGQTHPCLRKVSHCPEAQGATYAGAMLIFSVSFQFYRMQPEGAKETEETELDGAKVTCPRSGRPVGDADLLQAAR